MTLLHAGKPPEGMDKHGSVVVGNRLYVFRGYHLGSGGRADVHFAEVLAEGMKGFR